VDAGDPADLPADDILGNPRGAMPDLGVFERGNPDVQFADGFEA
jgi:hypothetical protein